MIRHITRFAPITMVDGKLAIGDPTEELPDFPSYQLTDQHDVSSLISTSWPGVGRCDSCGRIIVRGMGRWWDRGEWR